MLSRLFSLELCCTGFSHLELLYLPGDSHRVAINEFDIPGHLVPGNSLPAVVFNVISRQKATLFHLNPRAEFLTVVRVGDTDNMNVLDERVRVDDICRQSLKITG